MALVMAVFILNCPREKGERSCRQAEECTSVHCPQLFYPLLELVLLMLQLLLLTEALAFFKRLVLPMPLFINSVRGICRFGELGR